MIFIQAVLVAANCNQTKQDFNDSLDELKELARACQVEVLDVFTQNLERTNTKTYLGKGKLIELQQVVEQLEVPLVIFNDELTPAQINNITAVLQVEVIDRTSLILEIFALRAKSKEAKLQVEIATLKYLLPHLIGSETKIYSQQGGKGFRGAGETKLELDRRRIKKDIVLKTNELAKVVLERKNQRKKRQKSKLPVVCLVGYTNSGKSTLMNSLIEQYNQMEKQVFAENMLFATLETSTRVIKLKNNNDFLLTDTVGFVNRLPHDLVEAFKSTLEEVQEADLLIHVVDSANANYLNQIETTNKVLAELNADHIPMIYVNNKCDLVEDISHPGINISAKHKINLDQLIEEIMNTIYANNQLFELLIPYHKSNEYSYLKQNYQIIQEKQTEFGYELTVSLPKKEEKRFISFKH